MRTELEEKETAFGDSLAESRAMPMIANQDLDEARRLNGTLERESEDAKGRADALRKLADALAKVESQARESAAAAAAATRLSAAEDATSAPRLRTGRYRGSRPIRVEARRGRTGRLPKKTRARGGGTPRRLHRGRGERARRRARRDRRQGVRERELAKDQIERLCEALLISESAEGKTAGKIDGAMSVEVARLRQSSASPSSTRATRPRARRRGEQRAEAIAALEERAERAEVERDRLESMMRPMRDELERLTAIVNEQTGEQARGVRREERDVLAELESQKEIVRAAMSDASKGGWPNSVDLEKLEGRPPPSEAALVCRAPPSGWRPLRRRLRARAFRARRERARSRATRAGTHGEGARIDGGKARRVQGERRGGDPPRRDLEIARVQALETVLGRGVGEGRGGGAVRGGGGGRGDPPAAQPRAAKGRRRRGAGGSELAEEVKAAVVTRLMFRWRNQATSHAFIAWRDGASCIERDRDGWRRRWPAGGGACSSRFPSTIGTFASVVEERRRLKEEETEARAGALERQAGEFRTQAERLVAEA